MSATCTDCPRGKAVDTQHLSQSSGIAGATVCEDCELGMYAPDPAQSKCNECAINTFQNETGKDFCYNCPMGYRTDHDKQDHCMAWPTSAPTGQPTGSPTRLPTSSPTTVPTRAPTGQPTGSPTAMPTNPTGRPTTQPTGSPTGSPTGQPTRSPTGQPTDVPTGQPTSSPTLYIPENQLRSGDPLSSVGVSSSVFAASIIGAMLCCCILVGCMYRRRRASKTKEPELSPYEKWMQAEEAKRAGVQAPMFHSDHGAGAKLDRKAVTRANKLHTKHGVAISDATRPNLMQPEGPASALGSVSRPSEMDMDVLYGDEDNIQGTWGDMGYVDSTHNPLAGGLPARDSATVDGTEFYGGEDSQNGYWAEDGQWYTYDESSGGAYRDSAGGGHLGNDGVDDVIPGQGSTHNPLADQNNDQAFDEEGGLAGPDAAGSNERL